MNSTLKTRLITLATIALGASATACGGSAEAPAATPATSTTTSGAESSCGGANTCGAANPDATQTPSQTPNTGAPSDAAAVPAQ
ncbi:MAG: hypothetical protein IPK60_06445 [Sandaracinaceae bacterium]|nr:hypothetical protein [Sandaracinaceae bacterium]